MKASIQPVSILGKTASVLNIVGVNVRLGHFATLNYILTDDNQATVYSGDLTMPSEDYALWGTDDTYAFEYAAGKLGLTILEMVPAPAVPTPLGG